MNRVSINRYLTLILFSFVATTSSAQSIEHYVHDELLVKFKSHSTSSSRNRVASVAQAIEMGGAGRSGFMRVKIVGKKSLAAAMAAYAQDETVESVQPNFIYRASAAPTDPLYADQWAFKNTAQTVRKPSGAPDSPVAASPVSGADMNIEPAWAITEDCSSVKVAVVDTGINTSHEDLQGNFWDGSSAGFPGHGADFTNGQNPPGTNAEDRYGHGTHVSATIAAKANNGVGGVGVCHQANLMSIRVLDSTGVGTTADIASGMAFALDKGAKIINMSLGGPSYDSAFQNAIVDAQNRGAIVVTAAGNEGDNVEQYPTYPCNFSQSNLICVAALGQDGALTNFSNYGTTSVDVAAPGENIVSAWFGTSQYETDSLSTGWTFARTTGSNWSYGSSSLTMPSNYDGSSIKYAASTNGSAYKEFAVSSAAAVVLETTAVIDVARNDRYQTAFKVGTGAVGSVGTPYSSGGILIDELAGSTGGDWYSASYDVSECSGKTCSIGFRLLSQASSTGDLGIEVLDVTLRRQIPTSNAYNVIRGTSMAAPHAAGLAALIWAYNPSYTASDVVEAVTKGGRAVAALSGKVRTGNTLDAMSSLRYIRAPDGVHVH